MGLVRWGIVALLLAAKTGSAVAISIDVFDQYICLRQASTYCTGETLPPFPQLKSTAKGMQKLPIDQNIKMISANKDWFCWLDQKATLQCRGQANETLKVTNIDQVISGQAHTCYRDRTGIVACFGDNTYGQLGDGTTQSRQKPIVVKLTAKAIDLALGASHSCALLATGKVACWGSNYGGQTGQQLKTRFPTPQIHTIQATPNAIFAAPDGDYTCATFGASRECWGSIAADGNECQKRLPAGYLLPQGETGVRMVATRKAIYGLRNDGKVTMWKPDVKCKKPVGAIFNRPVAVRGMAEGAKLIGATSRMVCSLMDAGQVKCYGKPWHAKDDQQAPFILPLPK